MRQAVIVSYARTGLTPAGSGGFNHTPAHRLLGHAIRHAVLRAGVEAADIEDVVAGCTTARGNVARAGALQAGLPVTTAGVTVHRACASGLNAIALAAHHIVEEGASVVVGGGVDFEGLVQPFEFDQRGDVEMRRRLHRAPAFQSRHQHEDLVDVVVRELGHVAAAARLHRDESLGR
jgi:acetyl-CoA C-acetyltransferase